MLRISRYRWLAFTMLILACQLVAARVPAYALSAFAHAVHAKHEQVAHVAVESSNAVAASETKPQEHSKQNTPIKSDSASAHMAQIADFVQCRDTAGGESRSHITYRLWLLNRTLLL
jgi:hypothetical protein